MLYGGVLKKDLNNKLPMSHVIYVMNKKHTLSPEWVIYAVLWAMLYLMPVALFYIRASLDPYIGFRWGEVWHVWAIFTLFFVCFLIHNFLLAPLLLGKRRKMYVSLTLTMLVSFFLVQTLYHRPYLKRNQQERIMERMRQERLHGTDRHRDPFDLKLGPPMGPIGPGEILNTLILLGLLGINIGVKFYFKTEHARATLQQLDKDRLYQQLQYLKYQINPHFFMNTLNNIQVLIDMDAEKAKAAIRELSVMMRFVLYEADNDWVALPREMEFLRNYMRLMRLRHSKDLRVDFDVPDNLPNVRVPPLIFVTFVENAFKHGGCNGRKNFISLSLDVDGGQIIFHCINSKGPSRPPAGMPREGGVGLRNVKRRLDIIYGELYSLKFTDNTDAYAVDLTMPIKTPDNPSDNLDNNQKK